jgi:hypothetical protein
MATNYTVAMGAEQQGDTEVMATVMPGSNSLVTARAIAKAIAKANPGRIVGIWRGDAPNDLGTRGAVARYRGESRQAVRVIQVVGNRPTQ